MISAARFTSARGEFQSVAHQVVENLIAGAGHLQQRSLEWRIDLRLDFQAPFFALDDETGRSFQAAGRNSVGAGWSSNLPFSMREVEKSSTMARRFRVLRWANSAWRRCSGTRRDWSSNSSMPGTPVEREFGSRGSYSREIRSWLGWRFRRRAWPIRVLLRRASAR